MLGQQGEWKKVVLTGACVKHNKAVKHNVNRSSTTSEFEFLARTCLVPVCVFIA